MDNTSGACNGEQHDDWRGDPEGNGDISDDDAATETHGAGTSRERDTPGAEGRLSGYQTWAEAAIDRKRLLSVTVSAHAAIAFAIFALFMRAPALVATISILATYIFSYILSTTYLTEGGAVKISSKIDTARPRSEPKADMPPPEPSKKEVVSNRMFLVISRNPLRMMEAPEGLSIWNLDQIINAIDVGRLPGGIVSGRKLAELNIVYRDSRSTPNGTSLLAFLVDAGIAQRGSLYHVINRQALADAIQFTKEEYAPRTPPLS